MKKRKNYVPLKLFRGRSGWVLGAVLSPKVWIHREKSTAYDGDWIRRKMKRTVCRRLYDSGRFMHGRVTPLYGLNSGHNTSELQRLAALVQTVSVYGFNWVYRLFVRIGNGRAVYSRTDDSSQHGTTIEGRLLWWFVECVRSHWF